MTADQLLAEAAARGLAVTVGPAVKLPTMPGRERTTKAVIGNPITGSPLLLMPKARPGPTFACVEVPPPPSVNNLFTGGKRSHKRHKSKNYRAWLKVALPILARLEPPGAPQFAVRLTVYGGPRLNTARDLDNFTKPILDGLVTTKVIADDSIRAGLVGVIVWYKPPVTGRAACVMVEFQAAESQRAG